MVLEPLGRMLVIGVTPLAEPNALLVAAVERAGGLGVLDLGRNRPQAEAALADAARWVPRTFGVRVAPGCPLVPADLPSNVDTVLLAADAPWTAALATGDGPGRLVLAEVCSVDEARAALAAGAGGLVARGAESGGRVGELTTFVLLQTLLADLPGVDVWAAGGIGLHTAAAAVAGGARGVVLDSQLALVREAGLPRETVAAIGAMDGSETVVVGGHRVFTRPDLPVAEEIGDDHVALRLGSGLRTALVPVGQDGALARPLAERHVTAGGVVQAVRASIREHLTVAAGAPGAGLRHPVVQGPMTRVSDRAAFALAVAEGGGLPFLALALMTGAEVRRLLDETAELLGDRPWGVGILGFTPPEVREAQVAVVHEVRPPYALIAGGRPSQAAPLEAAGIATYLHVPSPGLLDRFLREGARRFVFEGFECGGHVGPRASFPLWETQIERLLAVPEALPDLHVLFAGGIGDERSAAMVAAAAAPLTAAGASVGVLMGTAYLFTEEAVAAGAILPGFQRQAVECRGTVLLETSPGHATRCAPTPYVGAFDETRRRLTDAGASQQEMWLELERLNLGRLRIASKGLRREGDVLASVDEGSQERDGMYMIGQVAALRDDVTTVEALHAQVTSGAAAFLADRMGALGLDGAAGVADGADGARPLDVAIVGMACVYPDAPDAARFWANVVAGVDSITEVPATRWDTNLYYDRDAFKDPQGRTPSKWGGFIPAVPFDALAYGIPPTSLVGIEPVQLLALQVAAAALADAGYGGGRPFRRDRTSVIFGAEAGTDLASAYGLRSTLPAYLGELPPALDEHLPHLTEDSFPGVLTNVIAGRIANRLDLGGVNYTVDAACAASLAALDIACKELRTGTSDMVLCGAGDLHNGIHDYLMFASVHALSPTGRCATFDGDADGIALGEGVACVVLKRLEDAERDGDRVYAVIKAVAGSSDGKSLGLTAPRPEGQRAALERAYRMAGVSPSHVGLVEAHGTGTVVGDRTELAALTDVFTVAGASPGSAVLGSVKSQVGHTKCAAGLAGLIKTALALHTGVRPGTLHLTEPNPYWDASTSPFRFAAGAGPWPAAPGDRYAGVSAFGFGGTNFHAVLSGYDGAPEPAHGLDEWPAELFLFTGPGDVDRLAELIAANDGAGRPWALRDLAASLARGRGGAVVSAVVADDLDDLAAKVDRLRAGTAGDGVFLVTSDGDAAPGRVAFLFPGQGSQRPGMLADLFVAFPRLQQLLRLGGGRYAPVMFPPLAFTRDGKAAQQAAITDTRSAQPTLGIAGLAVHEVLASVGVRPDLAAGHSYGELVALAAAGAITPDDLLGLSSARAAAVLDAAGDDPGGMAAVAASAADVERAVGGIDGLVLANHNAPLQTVISGTEPALAEALAGLAAAGLPAKLLPVACAFHSPVVAGAAKAFGAVLESVSLGETGFDVWSNTTAAPHQGDLRAALAAHLARPVRFVDEIEAMYAAGARVFVESGPGGVLTRLVGAILGDRPHTAVACDTPGEHGVRSLLRALAELAVAGVPVDTEALFAGRACRTVAAADVPRRPGWLVDGHLVRRADGEPLVGGLLPAKRVALGSGPVAAVGLPSDREATVLQFLQSTRELVAVQRDVMLAYLGSAPAAPLVMTNGHTPAVTEVSAAPAVVAATAAPAPAPVPAAAEPAPVADLTAVVLDVVSARTGYPREMLDPDLDLEADLSIGSIKRTEMIGELADRLGLGGAAGEDLLDESLIEDLARIKTIAGIVGWLRDHLGVAGGTPAATPTSDLGDRPLSGSASLGEEDVRVETGPVESVVPGASRMRRYLVELDEIAHPAPAPLSFAGRRFVLVDDGRGIALELADLLEQRGAAVTSTDDSDAIALDPLAAADEVVHLAALRPGPVPVLPSVFAGIRRALVAGTPTVLLATGSAGTFGHGWTGEEATDPSPGAGLRGLARTLAREYPDVLVRAVDVDTKEAPAKVARHLLDELATRDAPVVVGYTNGTRSTLTVVESPVAATTTPADLGLGPDAVVLLTGGARGITAQAAVAIAAASGCHVELVGRTPPPSGVERPATAHADGEIGLRHALIESGVRKPAEVEAAVRRILAEREVRTTLEALAGRAASVRYHVADVRQPDALRAVVDDVYARHGRLDGVVHGAGVCDDGLVATKSPESFARVFETKVTGASTLAAALRPEGLRFLALFGSVSGVAGNRGQADYAAANDALDTLARVWRHRLGGARVLSVDWGPWSAAGGGMVSASLEAEYARRGVTTIDPEEGVAALLAELAAPAGGPSQVVYTTVLGLDGGDARAADG